jgi:hypothetical protein
MTVENTQNDAKVSPADKPRKTPAGASQARSGTRPLQNQRTWEELGAFLSRRARGAALRHSDILNFRFEICPAPEHRNLHPSTTLF